MKRVVVTGIGVVSPIGNSLREAWGAAKSGISGIMPIQKFDATGMQWGVSGEVKGFHAETYLAHREIRRLDLFIHYAVAAAVMAAEDAGLTEKPQGVSNTRTLASAGVIIGSSRGGIGTVEKEMHKLYSSGNAPHGVRTSAYLMPSTTISMAASYVAQKLGIRGYCLGISNACASGTNAIGEAFRLIQSGYRYPVLCGGTEAPVCRTCVAGYGSSGALSSVRSSAASRPFDRTRDGFVLAEGSCILVLEDLHHAVKRGARIYGEVTGYGNTTDAFHQTMPSSEGEARAITMAIKQAKLQPSDIHLINAHGTSTPLGDKTETEAIKLSLGRLAYRVPVTSVKSLTGHMLAASGALEAAFTLMSMHEGIIMPTINLRERDPECDLDYVTEPRKTGIVHAISHSFGFGGLNAVLVFRQRDS